MQFCTPQQRLCGNLSIGVKKWSRFPQRNLMLAKFYFLVNLRKEEEAAWLSCKLILLSLLWIPSSFPRGFTFWVTEPYTAFCHRRMQHMGSRCWQAVCQDGIGIPLLLLQQMWLHFRKRVWRTHLWPGPPAFDDQHIPAACSQWN